MTASSALYVGSVMHRRLRPRVHRFHYRAFWLLFDLDELDTLGNRLRLLSHNGGNLFSLHDADHGDGGNIPLRAQAERLLNENGIDLAGGAIRMLCMPRTLGYSFNPLTVYFCHRGDGSLAALIHEVHNTFGKRHSYVLPVGAGEHVVHQRCRKAFYVSPFMDMDLRYDFRVAGPDERVTVGISATGPSGVVISAVMSGVRRPLTDRNLLVCFLAMPVLTLKVIAAIHWEALRLWLKGLRPQWAPRASAAQPRVAVSHRSAGDEPNRPIVSVSRANVAEYSLPER